MENYAIHLVMVFQNLKQPEKYEMICGAFLNASSKDIEKVVKTEAEKRQKQWKLTSFSHSFFNQKKPGTIHYISTYRNKNDPKKYMQSSTTLTGIDLDERMKTIATTEMQSWSEVWELVSFSHSFSPTIFFSQI